MVSLRSSFSARNFVAAAGKGLVLLGVLLGLLHLVGLVLHLEMRADPARQGSLREYAAALSAGRPFELGEATRQVYLGTIHSDDRRLAITENWLQWTLAKLHPPLACTQDTDRLIAGSIANCGERSQILRTLAEQAGHDCRFVGLSGHVVLEVRTDRGWRVADPDYGVVYPLGIDQLQQQPKLVRQTLADAHYSPDTIEHYVGIVHSAEDNVVLPIGSPLSPRLDAVERACDWLAPLLPYAVAGLGLVLLRAGGLRTAERRGDVTPDRPALPAHAA